MRLDLDLEVPRNGHYHQRWEFTDNEHAPLDLTGYVFTMAARDAAGVDPIIANAEIEIVDAAAGIIEVKWTGSDFASVPGDTEIVRIAYDLRMEAPDDVAQILVRGHLILFPEVTPWP